MLRAVYATVQPGRNRTGDAAVCYVRRPMANGDSRPGAASAIGAYVALLVGMLAIGAPAQQHGIVAGLWITEGIAIALPAIFALLVAGARFAPFLGLRGMSWRQALVAIVVAAANQPIVSFLTWAEREQKAGKSVDEAAAEFKPSTPYASYTLQPERLKSNVQIVYDESKK